VLAYPGCPGKEPTKWESIIIKFSNKDKQTADNENQKLSAILTSRKACARNMMLLSTALTIFARMYFGQTLKAIITNIGPIRNLATAHQPSIKH